MAVWWLAGPGVSEAQVVIEERVEIVGDSTISKTSGTPVTFIVPTFDGWLQIQYFSADRVDSQIPPSARLSVDINGAIAGEDSVLARIFFDSAFPRTCFNQQFVQYIYQPVSEPPAKSFGGVFAVSPKWTVIQVLAGDQIQLDYDGGQALPYGATYTQFTDSSWVANLGVDLCTGSFRAENLEVGVQVLRDSLDIVFSPSETDTLPEPGLQITVTAKLRGSFGTGDILFELQPHRYFAPMLEDSVIVFSSSMGYTPELVTVIGDSASTTLMSTEYWGAVDVTAKFVVGTDTLFSKTERWPRDADRDGIADAWEDSTGGRSLGGSPLDFTWDLEGSTGNVNFGDGITKLSEYIGVLIGSNHRRLDPERKEVFFDIHNFSGPEAEWAVGQVYMQLNIDTIMVAGLMQGTTVLRSGPTPLRWLGSMEQLSPYRNNVLVRDSTEVPPGLTADQTERFSAQVVNFDKYYWTDVLIGGPTCVQAYQQNKTCQPSKSKEGAELGGTTDTRLGLKDGARSAVFRSNIENLYSSSVNNIGEVFTHDFQYRVAETSGDSLWIAYFRGTGTGTPNPLDLLSMPTHRIGVSQNDPVDNRAGTNLMSELLQRNALHEIGHALGIAAKLANESCPPSSVQLDPETCHPETGDSVMRGGFGPAKTDNFSSDEIGQMRLK